MKMKRLRVTRTIVFEGPEDWIDRTLEKSLCGSRGTATERPDAIRRTHDILIRSSSGDHWEPQLDHSIKCVEEKVEEL